MGDLISGLFGVIQLIIVAASNLFKTSSEGSSAINEAWAATWGGGSTLYRVGFVLGIFLWISALERLDKARKRQPSEAYGGRGHSDSQSLAGVPKPPPLEPVTEPEVVIFDRIRDLDDQGLRDLVSHYPQAVWASSPSGQTPLHTAVEQDNVEAARILLAHGARVTARDGQHRTPYDIALSVPNSRVEGILRQYGATAGVLPDRAGDSMDDHGCVSGASLAKEPPSDAYPSSNEAEGTQQRQE